ncbi:hypothetical protein FH972_002325 [Carpinus fangiana]|uniref:Uncharacterized protein n=1 Tax=Carpinus fangiana TaxID=176857 RepID=A0A5N6QEI4_9ROSI|nr:hypothetical protein FH972_002325 [Carpinus fangiana]
MEVGTKKEKMGFEETELRLGLPGNGATTTTHEAAEVARKRGFSETETSAVDLKLNLSSKEEKPNTNLQNKNNLLTAAAADPAKPPAK